MYAEFDTHSSHDKATAHVMIKCKPDCLHDVLEQLHLIDGIVEIFQVIGEYDVLAKVESISAESLKRIIKWKILYNNEKIISITTLLCMRKPLCVIME